MSADRNPAAQAGLTVLAVAGIATIQDRGRPGLLAQGLSRGGAADPVALAEGAALLGQGGDLAAVELMSASLRLRAGAGLRIALTGAPMRATLTHAGEARPLAWNASHAIPPDAELALAPGAAGGFGYLHLGGGIDAPLLMGARSAHLAGGVGRPLAAGDRLVAGADAGGPVDRVIEPLPRFGGGTLRAVESLQTPLYGAAQLARLQATAFRRDSHGNRMGVRLDLGGAPPFEAEGGLTVVSEIVQPGDIQITGDGTPFLLLAECQTTGGYPRIATVLPCDLPIAAQAAPGSALRIRMVGRDEALAALHQAAAALAALPRRVGNRLRDPAQMADLLAYSLVGGVVDAARPDHFDHHLEFDPQGTMTPVPPLSIDLNADMGEGFGPWPMGDDAALLDVVSSANVACGLHGGDWDVMARTMRLAAARGVGIGAHPGLPDLQGFGRREMQIAPESAANLVRYQLGAARAMAAAAGAGLRHLKLHGALANMASRDPVLARACYEGALSVDPDIIVMVLAGTAQEAAARALGARLACEIFADRGYNDDATLIARGQPGAMIHDPAEAAPRIVQMVREGAIVAASGKRIPTRIDTICLHGDNPGAVALARAVRAALDKAGITVAPFAGAR